MIAQIPYDGESKEIEKLFLQEDHFSRRLSHLRPRRVKLQVKQGSFQLQVQNSPAVLNFPGEWNKLYKRVVLPEYKE
jgi:hypothetical protein